MEKRAISAEQKEERRREILDITKKEFLNADFHNIKMADIAKAAGIAKGTLFFYFKTKEELFLTLARLEISRWNDQFDKMLRDQIELKKRLSLKEFKKIILETFDKNNTLISLFAILDDTLEHNIELETAFEFKSFLMKRIINSGNLIEQALPFIKKGDGSKMFYYAFILIVGIYKVTNPSPIIKKVSKNSGMEMFNLNFNNVFSEMLDYLLLGYRSNGNSK